MTKFKERIASKELNEAYERIRQLEALVNANTDHMTEVGVELCRERDARISELEAENQLVKDDFDRMQRECKHEKMRAEKAEATIERLRVCGNCKWFRAEEFQYCGLPDIPGHMAYDHEYYISAPDKCDFTPSRWTERRVK